MPCQVGRSQVSTPVCWCGAIFLCLRLTCGGAAAGTTAVLALVDGDQVVVASCGDSRAVLCDARGNAVPLTTDHKPDQVRTTRSHVDKTLLTAMSEPRLRSLRARRPEPTLIKPAHQLWGNQSQISYICQGWRNNARGGGRLGLGGP